MKHDHRNGELFGLPKRLFQQTLRDPWKTIMHLTEQFQLLGAESRDASLTPQQLSQRGSEGRKPPHVTLLRLMVGDTCRGLLLLLRAMCCLQHFQVGVVQRRGRRSR